VSKEIAAGYAKKLGIPSFQVSAKSGDGVETAFSELLKIVQKKIT
jgi:hypothetical protein